MHFSLGMLFDPIFKGNKQLMMVFITTALVILLISCINFTNLFVSTSFFRAKAIGTKKAHGAQKFELACELHFETACYVIIAKKPAA